MSEQHLPLNDYIEYPQSEMLERAKLNYLNVKRRHSIRSFSDKAVPKEIIEQCILAAGTAPNGANHQPWHFVAISSDNIKSQIREQAEAIEQAFYGGRGGDEWLENLKPLGTNSNKPYLETAPWLIAIFSKKRSEDSDEAKQNYYVHESLGIATGFLIQALHNSGLATLTHTPKPMSFLSKICGRDNDNERPYMLIVAGYPDPSATVPEHALNKKALNEICDFL